MKRKKIINKLLALCSVMCLLLGAYSTVNATNEKTQLQIVQEASEAKKY